MDFSRSLEGMQLLQQFRWAGLTPAGTDGYFQTFEIDPIRYRPGSGLPLNISAIKLGSLRLPR